jgi:hypothetical protein
MSSNPNPLSLAPENAIFITRGSAKTLALTVTDPDSDPKDPTPIDLTDARVVMSVKVKAEDRDPLIFKSSDDPDQVLITQPREGVAKIFLVPSDTKNLDIRAYVFDVWVVLSNGKPYPVVPPSVFEVEAGVTVLP